MKQFQSFRLDTSDECLWHDGHRLALTRKAFAVLNHLVEQAGHLVTKEELMEAVWPETYVQEEILKTYVRKLRQTLGDDAQHPLFIETQQGRGYRFIAEVSEETSDDTVAADSPALNLFDREENWRQLEIRYDKARKGERQIVFITGEAGIGKTALTEAFMSRSAAQSNVRSATGQCVESYREQEPYYPILEAIGRLCRGSGGEQMVELLTKHAPTWLVQFASLVKPELRESLQREMLGATRGRMMRELCEVLEALTAETPLLLLLEDLHWADYSTVDLLSALARRQEPARLMLLATYRPVEVILSQHPLKQLKHELQVHHQCQELPLELLSEAAVMEYLAARFPNNAFPTNLSGLIYRQTDGNPLFMVTLVEYLVGNGLLREASESHAWQLKVTLDEVRSAVPKSLQQIIGRQLEQLSPTERECLNVASVAGSEFSAFAVAGGNQDKESVEICCDGLAQRQLLLREVGLEQLPDGSVTGVYQFTHSLYREVLYRECSPSAKVRLHQRIGSALEQLWNGNRSQVASELARHFQEGHDYARAVQYLRLAAENAAQRFAYREAIAILEEALQAANKLPEATRRETELAVLEQLAGVQDNIGDKAKAIELYETLVESAEVLGQHEVGLRALVSLSNVVKWFDGPRSVEICERAALMSGGRGDDLLRVEIEARVSYLRMVAFGWRQDLDETLSNRLERLRVAAEPSRCAQVIALRGLIQLTSGDYEGAERGAAEALPLLIEAGDAPAYAQAYADRARALVKLGRLGDALRAFRELVGVTDRNGDTISLAIGRIVLAGLHCEAFDFVGASAICRTNLPVVRGVKLNLMMQRSLLTIGIVDMRLGNFDGALEALSELRAIYDQGLPPLGWYWKVRLHGTLSELWLARGDMEAARQEADLFRELSDRNPDRAWRARARLTSARVAQAEKDWSRAESEIAEALTLIEGRIAPLAAWRIFETAAEIYEQKGRKAQTKQFRRMRNETLQGLADSLGEGEPLRRSILDAMGKPVLQ
jgi:DNA-binding winged helix-turn-helix (wHTH) protein/tetratricopeptide (TPR) repeat protein